MVKYAKKNLTTSSERITAMSRTGIHYTCCICDIEKHDPFTEEELHHPYHLVPQRAILDYFKSINQKPPWRVDPKERQKYFEEFVPFGYKSSKFTSPLVPICNSCQKILPQKFIDRYRSTEEQ